MPLSDVLRRLEIERALKDAGSDPGEESEPSELPVRVPRRKRYDPGVRSNYSEAVPLLAGEQMQGEATRNIVACNDYLRLGPARSTKKLAMIYDEQEAPPTKSWASLQAWSSRFDWFHRAEMYDAEIEMGRNEIAEAALYSGFALPYKRVEALKRLAARLQEELAVESNLWLRDYRMLGRGRDATFAKIRRFNASLIEQFRGVLADIAEETGGRQKTLTSLNYELNDLTDEQLEMIAAGKRPYDVVRDRSVVVAGWQKSQEEKYEWKQQDLDAISQAPMEDEGGTDALPS